MKTVRTVVALRELMNAARVRGARVGLVPTLGALHEGHLALMRQARIDCDVVVVSLFVNPTQFGDAADLAAYPRNEARDESLASGVGADVLFAPLLHEVYPHGFNTSVHVGGITAPLEGAARGPLHFQGVATVVTKLFNMVQPHVAYFGQKDVQQTLVIRQLVRDLDMPIEIVVCPTVREADGLAMSSRNARLDAGARARAVGLHEALLALSDAVLGGERNSQTLLNVGREKLLAREIASSDIEYFAIVDSDTLEPLLAVKDEALCTLAVRVGGVRLIDNAVVHAN